MLSGIDPDRPHNVFVIDLDGKTIARDKALRFIASRAAKRCRLSRLDTPIDSLDLAHIRSYGSKTLVY